ncbi:D-aminoacyl-tRNA deacylase [Aciduricibacillus chroicocephali]|uniref:D-aminoacyl-tRNA deacylase n=1 Tax=Aciduricibacillus chroicocephali TaxID=3054939 RepID=A0ABY9KSZ8_9BACI|nr:D-aminoacyl-tRNA deacylase [Bacillaceae bacterium 44XB]
MRLVIQRSKEARVEIAGETVGEIDRGLVILVGVTHGDTEEDAKYLAQKCMNLRIFEDEAGKMNLSLLDAGGQVLSISQFTLYGDTRKGRRPSFVHAAKPEEADVLYQFFNEELRQAGLRVATGQFGADMQVHLMNDGPVTFILDSKDK